MKTKYGMKLGKGIITGGDLVGTKCTAIDHSDNEVYVELDNKDKIWISKKYFLNESATKFENNHGGWLNTSIYRKSDGKKFNVIDFKNYGSYQEILAKSDNSDEEVELTLGKLISKNNFLDLFSTRPTKGITNESAAEFDTMYYTDGFGSISKMEIKLIECGTRQYAQYSAAPFVKYVQKGKRKPSGYIKGYEPYILILKGIGHPEPASMFDKVSDKDGVSVSKSRYLSYDKRYKTDFDRVIDEYIKDNNVTVLFDHRSTKGMGSHGKPTHESKQNTKDAIPKEIEKLHITLESYKRKFAS